jgi:ribosome-associated protein
MDEDDLISKTQRKRRMHDLQDVGAALVELSEAELARLDLPERLHDAVLACKGIKKHEARRRQMQFIGKLMRDIDSEPIAERLRALAAPTQRDTALLHLAEKWRTDLLDAPDAMARFTREFPGADAVRLANLVKGAKEERAASRPPKCFRELFHAVNALIQEQARRSA